MTVDLALSEAVLASFLLDVSMTDGEALCRLIHLTVAHGGLAGTASAAHRLVAWPCLFLSADEEANIQSFFYFISLLV